MLIGEENPKAFILVGNKHAKHYSLLLLDNLQTIVTNFATIW
jgi:hypothetical protein